MSTVGTLKKLLAHFPDDTPVKVWIDGSEYVAFDPKRSHWFHDHDYSVYGHPPTLKLGSNVNYELDPVYHLNLEDPIE